MLNSNRLKWVFFPQNRWSLPPASVLTISLRYQILIVFVLVSLTRFNPMFQFYTPSKHQKTWLFDIFRRYRRRLVAWNRLTEFSSVHSVIQGQSPAPPPPCPPNFSHPCVLRILIPPPPSSSGIFLALLLSKLKNKFWTFWKRTFC